MIAAGITIAVLLCVLIACELYARFSLGLGDPPLWMADPEIEYLQKPSTRYLRGGKRVEYNAYSMRCRDFPQHKTDPNELRVLLVGDSIVNGGAKTDQADIASALIERALADRTDRPVLVANIGANSWGPPNWQAYLKRFGLFDADVVVLVVNSYDYADAPTFKPLGKKRPEHKPLLAIQEIAEKYLPRLMRGVHRKLSDFEAPVTPEGVEWCLRATAQTIEMVRASGASVLMVQHFKRAELEGEPETGYHELRRVAIECGVDPISLGPAFSQALAAGQNPYRDAIHPNELGHRLIAERLISDIEQC